MSDYIKRDALKNQMQLYFNDNEDGEVRILENAYWHHKYVIELIDNAPSADVVERKRGEWIKLQGRWIWKCSECGIEVLYYAKGNYCPNCGARMVSDESKN